jgi:diguanylate cyclase (GGDEF)-like protein/PAS domain S-box-containing protein
MLDEKDFYREIIDNLYDGIYFVDRDRIITYWNKGAERITGYPASRTIGRACRDNLLNHVTDNGTPLCTNRCPLAAVMEDGKPREVEVFLHHADGHRLPVLVRASALRDNAGDIIGAIESFSSNASVISARRRLREMDQLVHTDLLTRISNRKHIEGRLHAAIAEFENTRIPAGVLFMDVDHFKRVNDTYGHEVGDKALCRVANTFRHALRATDVIGRWGGEEFVAILYDTYDEHTLFRAAEKVRGLTEASRLDINDQSLSVTISIGATRLYSNDTPESVIRRADQLMYRSKQAGRNRVTVG